MRADAAETIQNTVTITSDTPDPDPTNNTATELTPVNTAADLAVTKIASPNPAIHGQLLTYSILVQNLGPDPAVDGQITDMLPPFCWGRSSLWTTGPAGSRGREAMPWGPSPMGGRYRCSSGGR